MTIRPFKKIVLSALFSLLALTMNFSALAAPLSHAQPVVMGYWTNWSPYWPGKAFDISGSLYAGQTLQNTVFDSQVSHLNVLAYAFFEVNSEGVIQFSDPWSDLGPRDLTFCANNSTLCQEQTPSYGMDNFAAFSQLKNRYPNLKLIISIGGAGHEASFHHAFTHPDNFVNSLAAILTNYGIDGVDLDFEPSDWSTADANNYVSLAHQIRARLPNALITAAVSANPAVIQHFQASNWQSFIREVDYLGIMAYDFHGGFDSHQPTAFHSNLYSDNADPYTTHYSGDAAVQAYLAMGVPARKLVLGIPAYGRVVSGVEAGATHGLYQPFATTFSNGDLGEEMESYSAIIGTLLGATGGYTDYWYSNPTGTHAGTLSGVYAYNARLKRFVSFDNTAMIDAKAQYVKQNGLAGMMIWELRADVATTDVNNASLIKHMYDGLMN